MILDNQKHISLNIYIDIWKLAPVQSARGAIYFINLTDGFFSYWIMAFLSRKLADTILKVFKVYYIEAERQIGQKLKNI